MPDERTWATSLRQSFRLLPTPSKSLQIILESDGKAPDDVLKLLPYEIARAGTGGTGSPDPKRYRDLRQVFRSVGLMYEEGDLVRITPLGKATLWWLDKLNEKNLPVLAQYAAYALSSWQLKNPTPEGRQYASDVKVFPYTFIWRVMLLTDRRISSDELARTVLRITEESQIEEAAERIRKARSTGKIDDLGERVVDLNDRIIPWMSLASFGWTLIQDKSEGDAAGFYQIPDHTLRILERASEIQRPHLTFSDELTYLKHISRAAAVPIDLRNG